MNSIHVNIDTYKNPIYLTVFMILAVIQVVLVSAPIFGYSSLLVIFKDMKLYQVLCANVTKPLNSSLVDFPNTTVPISCSAQDKALNLPFAFGIILHTASKCFLGCIIDCVGVKTCQYLGCIFMMMFSICFAYIEQGNEYLVFIAFFILSIASSFLMLCPFQVVNILYKKKKAFFMSLLSGSVDGSTVVFIIYLEFYEGGLSLNSISIGYGIITTLLIMLIATLLYPSKDVLAALVDSDVRSNLHPKPDSPTRLFPEDFSASAMSSYSMYHESIQRSLKEIEEAERREALLSSLSHSLAIQWTHYTDISNSYDLRIDSIEKPYGTITENVVGYGSDSYGASGAYYADEKRPLLNVEQKKKCKLTPYSGSPLWRYIFSWLNLLCMYSTSVIMLKIVYFIANLDKYLHLMADSDTTAQYIKIFGYVQFSGVLVSPVCSLLFVQRTRKDADILVHAEELFLEKVKVLILPSVALISITLLLDGLQMFQSLHLSIPVFFFFLVSNSLLWCYVSLYYAYLFPAQYYCTMFGINMGVCGVVTFIQYPLLSLEIDYFHGQQVYINAIFLVLIGSTMVLPMYLLYFYKKNKSTKMIVEPVDL